MAEKTKKSEEKREGGLWIPNRIRNIPRSVLGDSEKMLLADIYNYGTRGYYKSNETIAKEYMTSTRTVRRWLANIQRGGFIHVKCPKGRYRTIWARSHPEVRAAAELWYRGKKIPKAKGNIGGHKSPTKADVSGRRCGTNRVSEVGHNCPTINKQSYKDNSKETPATDFPLPAKAPANQLLEDRNKEAMAQVDRLKRQFGSGKRPVAKMTNAEFNQRRQSLKDALFAD